MTSARATSKIKSRKTTLWTIINNSCKPKPFPRLSFCFQMPLLSSLSDFCFPVWLFFFFPSLLSTFIFVGNAWHSSSLSSSSFEHMQGWETTFLVVCWMICCFQKENKELCYQEVLLSSIKLLILPNPLLHCSYLQLLFFLRSFLPLLIFSQSLTSFCIHISTSLFLLLLQTPLSFCPWFYPWFCSSFSSASPSVLPLPCPGSPHHVSCCGIFVHLTAGDDWLQGKMLHPWAPDVQYRM